MTAWNKGRWQTRFRQPPSRSRRTWGRFQEPCAPAFRPKPGLEPAWQTHTDWPEFWDAAQRQLRSVGLRTGTLRVYRHILRQFRTFLSERGAGTRPGDATPALAREFLHRLPARHTSWSWTATHITVLRTVFDKLGGATLTDGIVTPKRPRRLHDVLEPGEVSRLFHATGSTRDRLVILLLYGCGLKTSELCDLLWSDVQVAERVVHVRFAGGTRQRQVLLPTSAIPLLQAESFSRQPTDPVFGTTSKRKSEKPAPSQRNACTKPESRQLHPLSMRTVERIVRRAAIRAGITKEVCCRTLRRSYAVQCLRDGMYVASLRQNLGHKHIASTLAYCRYLYPKTGGCGLGGAMHYIPAKSTTYASALGAIQCSAP